MIPPIGHDPLLVIAFGIAVFGGAYFGLLWILRRLRWWRERNR